MKVIRWFIRILVLVTAAAMLTLLTAGARIISLNERILTPEEAGDCYDELFAELAEERDPVKTAQNFYEKNPHMEPEERYSIVEEGVKTQLSLMPISLINEGKLPKNGVELFLDWFAESELCGELSAYLDSIKPLGIMTLDQLNDAQTAIFTAVLDDHRAELLACVDDPSDKAYQMDYVMTDMYYDIRSYKRYNQLPPNAISLFDEWFDGTDVKREMDTLMDTTIYESEAALFESVLGNKDFSHAFHETILEGIPLYLDDYLDEIAVGPRIADASIKGDAREKLETWFYQSDLYDPIESLISTIQADRRTFAASGAEIRYANCDAEAFVAPDLAAKRAGIIPAGTKLTVLSCEDSFWTLVDWNGRQVFVINRELGTIPPFNVSGEGAVATLKAGTYVKAIDRFENLPDYAADFYDWLVKNAVTSPNANSPLINPAAAPSMNYYDWRGYQVGAKSDTISFTFAPGAGYGTITNAAEDAVIKAMDKYANSVYYNTDCAYAAFKYDYPQVFWLIDHPTHRYIYNSNIVSYDASTGKGTVSYSVRIYFPIRESDYDCRHPEYRNVNTILSTIDAVEAAVADAMRGFPKNGTRLEQVRYINRWVTEHCFYNRDLDTRDENANECTGALLGMTGKSAAVCEAYALAMQVLCNEAGIPCIHLSGTSADSKGGGFAYHSWVAIQMEDGKWYGCDPTWNDVTYGEVAKSGEENEEYLLVGAGTVNENGLRFDLSHYARTNQYYCSIVLSNYPKLSETAYEFDRDMPETAEPAVDVWWRE